MIRRAISDDNPPIDQLVETKILPYIVNLLDGSYNAYDQLVIECLWISANVASGQISHINHLLELGIVPKAMNLLLHKNLEIKDNAVWVFGNIAGESIEFRDQLLETELVMHLEYIVNDKSYEMTDELIKDIAWLISLLFRGPPYPVFQKV